MVETRNLQDAIMNEVRKNIPVTLYLMNGFQMRGVIADYDDSVVVLEIDGRQHMIYKHAISTLVPLKPLNTTK